MMLAPTLTATVTTSRCMKSRSTSLIEHFECGYRVALPDSQLLYSVRFLERAVEITNPGNMTYRKVG